MVCDDVPRLMRRRTYLATGVTTVVGAVAGCLGGDAEDDGATTAEPGTTATTSDATTSDTTAGDATETTGTTPATTDGAATVTVATSDQYGEYLADAKGVTLYLFTNDEGSESTCYDGCAQTWPPLVVEGTPSAGDGVSTELGTTERRDGSAQVTAGGVPLYYYAPDESPGDARGQGVGGVWFLVAPDGSAIEGTGTAAGNGSAATDSTDGEDDGGSTDGGYQY